MGVRTIAKRAEVSITSVSRVLNNHPSVSDEIRQRVLAASNEVGYVPAVGRKSPTNVAIMYTGEFWLDSPFDFAVMCGISRGIEETDCDLVVLDARRARRPNETFTQTFLRKGIRGAILRTSAASRGICEAIAEEGFPAVVVGDRFENPKVSYICTDSRESSQEAVEHLIRLGHRRIALCTNVIDDSDHTDRFEGYRSALADHGLTLDPKLVLRSTATREGGVQVLRRLMTMPDRPTAIYMTDPMPAVGALAEARNVGIDVPNELSVVGFDDAELRYTLFPQLTAVCQNAAHLGQEAAAALINVIGPADNKGTPAIPIRKCLRSWLEIHGSTGPLRTT